MKKFLGLFFVTGMFLLCSEWKAYAADAVIDTSKASKGIVTVTLSNTTDKTIKAMVEKDSEKYAYVLIKNSVNLPLQMGTGSYKISVLENITGTTYKPLASESVKVETIDEKEMYKASIPMIEYSVSTKAVPAFQKLTDGKTTASDKVTTVYKDVISHYSYDLEKAKTAKSDYVPVIDDIYDAKKGICYDYAAIVGAALRSQGIPTKLVMGYVPDINSYHAWNEIYVNSKWIVVDTTYDAQLVKAGKQTTMERDRSKTKVLKTY